MEIKINKEIRNYRESIFFGLSLRQFICSFLAVATAVGLYFTLDDILGQETVSWVCIVGAAPVAAAGFFHYNGMTLEKFLVAWMKTSFLLSAPRVWKSENYYHTLLGRKEKKGK